MIKIKSLYNYLKESILDDVENTLKTGDSFADLHYWIENFKNLDAMGINVSNFIKEIKKHGAKPLHEAAIENGKYFVRIVHDYSKVHSYTLTFFYPVENEVDYWHYSTIHMQVPENKLQERRGYKKEIRILDNNGIYKVSDSYIKQEVAKTLSSRKRKMYSLPDKYKGIINLIKIEDKK